MALVSLVLADTAALSVFTFAALPMVFADTTATAVFTLAPLPLVFADTTAAAVYACAPLSLVLADAATATGFTVAPLLLEFADAAAATVLASFPASLVVAEVHVDARLGYSRSELQVLCNCSGICEDAAAGTVLAPVSPSRVLALGLAGLRGCSRMEFWRCGLSI